VSLSETLASSTHFDIHIAAEGSRLWPVHAI
jgi:hypothetical protein